MHRITTASMCFTANICVHGACLHFNQLYMYCIIPLSNQYITDDDAAYTMDAWIRPVFSFCLVHHVFYYILSIMCNSILNIIDNNRFTNDSHNYTLTIVVVIYSIMFNSLEIIDVFKYQVAILVLPADMSTSGCYVWVHRWMSV